MLNALLAFKDGKNSIWKQWLDDIQKNPHFSQESFVHNAHLKERTQALLNNLLETAQTKAIPDLSSQALEPIFKVWHHVLGEQIQYGFSIKDTALLLYSLKSVMVHALEQQSNLEVDTPEARSLNALIDILGLLTFELYSTEQETRIQKQSHQIEYLQTVQTEFTGHFVGKSPAIQAVYKAIGPIADKDISVLLEGESGVGKDVIANLIHLSSKRKNKPFITLNCGAIPKELMESELFGHEKGAFTGADQKRLGKFELADGGTLFLDEIGELTHDLQVKLLRVLQNSKIERVGGNQEIAIDTRIIAATNKNLKQAVDQGQFRLDLYYRLYVYPIYVPPLRDRKADILPLAQYFLDTYAKKFNSAVKGFSKEAEHYLENQPWPGNVRELENTIQRAVILAGSGFITPEILAYQPGRPLALPASQGLVEAPTMGLVTLKQAEKQAIQTAIKLKEGNLLQAAQALGISRTTLYSKIKEHGIK